MGYFWAVIVAVLFSPFILAGLAIWLAVKVLFYVVMVIIALFSYGRQRARNRRRARRTPKEPHG